MVNAASTDCPRIVVGTCTIGTPHSTLLFAERVVSHDVIHAVLYLSTVASIALLLRQLLGCVNCSAASIARLRQLLGCVNCSAASIARLCGGSPLASRGVNVLSWCEYALLLCLVVCCSVTMRSPASSTLRPPSSHMHVRLHSHMHVRLHSRMQCETA